MIPIWQAMDPTGGKKHEHLEFLLLFTPVNSNLLHLMLFCIFEVQNIIPAFN